MIATDFDHRIGWWRGWRILFLVCVPLFLTAGCGYIVGGGFPDTVHTIHVPTFQSDSYRRGIEFLLTEAVQQEIQKRTPFRLVNGPGADTRLTGRIIDVRKDVLGESAFDDPRELQLSLIVEMKWEDLRTGHILAQQQIPVAPSVVQLQSQTEFAPEVGQSLATGLQQAIDQLAHQIVDMMEAPW